MSRETHKVAIVVLCEAEGVDEHDAASAAQYAIGQALRDANQPDNQDKVGSVRGPVCSECGISWPKSEDRFDGGIDSDGNIRSHISCERWSPEELRRGQLADGYDEPLQDACEGSGKPPRRPDEPVVGFTRQDGLPIYARVHEIMDAGMAAGNGYLWLQPTWKGFR